MSIEVEDSTVYAVLVRDGQPIWRVKIVGETTTSVAVGSVTQSFKNVSIPSLTVCIHALEVGTDLQLLRSLGLLSTKWF